MAGVYVPRSPTTGVFYGAVRTHLADFLAAVDHSFEADVLACPRCGGRMIVLATIEDPAVIRGILTHLGLSMETGEPLAARGPP